MAPPRAKKRRTEDRAVAAVPSKDATPSDSETEPDGALLDKADGGDSDDEYATAESDPDGGDDGEPALSDDDSDAGSIDSVIAAQDAATDKKRKRYDPDAFATSMSKILGSHLTTGARKDPVLIRAKQVSSDATEAKQEAKARRILKEEKRKEKEKGRVRELVPQDDAAAKKALEKERALRAVARSGVARLYNAIRAAQTKGEEAAKGVKKEGVIGMANRETKVTEMSKQGFLSLIQSDGKK